MNQTKTTPNPTPANKVSDFFENLGSKAFLIALLLITIVAFFVFKDFLLLKNVFQFKDIGSDTLNGMYPYYYHYADYFHKNGWPTWSFAEGMGQGIMSGFLRDPFQLIPILIGTKSMPEIFIFIEVLKIVIAGGLFYLFLKALKISNYTAIIGSLLFSFCGFMIIGACWYLFTFEALNMAVLLLGFERLYQKNKWFLFAFGIFLAGISFPVNIFTYGLFFVFYAAFRFLQEHTFERKAFLAIYGKMILAGLIGILVAGPFLLENIYQVLDSPRGGSDSNFSRLAGTSMFATSNKVEFGSSVMRMFSNDILGTGNNFTGIQNFLEAPFGYCGLISLLLFAQIFPLVSKSVRRWYIILFIVWVFPTFFPYFRYAFWLFSGDYFRAYSFFLSIIFILFSAYALDIILKTKKISLVALAVALGVWLILGSIKYSGTVTLPDGQQYAQTLKTDGTIGLFTKIFLIAYAVLLFFLGRSKKPMQIKYALLVLIAFELIYLSQFSVNRRFVNAGVPAAVTTRELKEKVGYNDYSIEAIKYIKDHDKTFYRVDKSYYSGGAMHGSVTDHKVHGYYSTSSYNSFSQMNFINYMRAYDVIAKNSEYASRWVSGLIVRPLPILQTLNNVKYVLTKNRSQNGTWLTSHDSVSKFGDVIVLKNKFELPLGYTYDKYIAQTDFDRLSTMQKDFVSLKAVVLDDTELAKAPGLKRFNVKDTVGVNMFTWDYFKTSVDSLKQEAMTTTLFSEDKINGNVNVKENKMMYLSFPYDKGWHLKVDGKETEKVFVSNGMTGVYLTPGNHTVNLEYHLRHFNKGLILMLVGLVAGAGLWFFQRKKAAVVA